MQSIARSIYFTRSRLLQLSQLERSSKRIVARQHQKSLHTQAPTSEMTNEMEIPDHASHISNDLSSEKFIVDNVKNILRSHYDSPLPEKAIKRSQLPSESTWRQSDPVLLSRNSLLDLFDLKIPAIHCPGFLSADVAQKLEDHLSPKLSPYTNSMGPPLFKVGLAQFEYQAKIETDLQNRTNAEKDRYFKEVEKYATLHEDMAEVAGQNVWATIINTISSLLPDVQVMVAQEGDMKYFSGIFRALNDSTPIHCDWSPYDSRTEDWIINRVEKQAVFNLYLAGEVKGGRTVVHDRPWTPECLDYRETISYGYYPEVVEGRQNCTIRPKQGDLWFFNSRNMHQVFPVELEPHPVLGNGSMWRRPRLTLSSFMGWLPAEKHEDRHKLIFWS